MSGTASGSTAVPGFVITGLLGDRGPWLAARQLGLDRSVAVKRLAASGDPAHFQAEIGIIGLLEHPGIVPLYDAGIDADGQPFYAMRDVHGVPWSDQLGTDPVRDHEVLQRVAEALAYAHHRGVAHGAITAACVLLGRHGEVLLTDWDAASTDVARQRDDLAALASLLASIRPGTTSTPAEDAAGFLAHLAHLRAADRAAAFRRDAEDALGCGDWAQARFAWLEAERADPGRNDAALGRRIALGYAAAAAARDDLALAVAVLDPGDPEQAAQRGPLLRQQERRRHRRRTLRRLALAAGLLATALGLALAIALLTAECNRQHAAGAAASAAARERDTLASTYAADLATVARLLADHRNDLAVPLLAGCPTDLRGWEWRRLRWLATAQAPELDLGQAAAVGPVVWQGGWIACRYGDDEIGLWRSAGPPERRIAMAQPPAALAIADDGSRLWQLGNGVLTCNDLEDGAVRWSNDIGPGNLLLALPDNRVLVASFGPKPMTIAILGRDGKQEHVLSVPQGLHLWARDGNGVLLTDWRRGAWRVSLEQATPTMTPLPGKHPGPMVALAGNRPDPLALVAYGNGNIGLVHLTQPGKRLDWIQEMNGTNHGAIAPDASRYASIDHETHTIMMYDRTRGGAPWRWHLPVMTSRLHFSPSGDALLAAGVERAFLLSFAPQPTWHAIASMPESIGPLLAKGRRLVLPDGRQGPEGHAAAITATATAADRIFSGDQDGWLLVWDAAHLRCLWRERIGSGPITAIVPGEPLRLRSGKDTLALPVMGR